MINAQSSTADDAPAEPAPVAAAAVLQLQEDLRAAQAALEAAEQAHRNEQLEQMRTAQNTELEQLQVVLNTAMDRAAQHAADVVPLLLATREAIQASTAAQAEAQETNRTMHFIREQQRLGPVGGSLNPHAPAIPDPIRELLLGHPAARSIRDAEI